MTLASNFNKLDHRSTEKVLSMSTTRELTSAQKRSHKHNNKYPSCYGNNSHLECKCGGGIIIITWQFVFPAPNTVYSKRTPTLCTAKEHQRATATAFQTYHLVGDHARHFSNRCDIRKVAEVIHKNWSDNHCNWSYTRPSNPLLELY